MKELLKDALGTIEYKIFKNGTLVSPTGDVKVTVFRNSVKLIDSQNASTAATGVFTYDLPTDVLVGSNTVPVTSDSGILDVTWSFVLSGNTMNVSEQYNVVTPYAQWDYFYGSTISYEDYLECERVSRYVINWYCGQQFEREYATFAIEGHGQKSLSLPKRLITLEDVVWLNKDLQSTNVISVDKIWEITSDGWILRQQPYRNYIDPVYVDRPTFQRNTTYSITGLWGYKSVPSEITEAAKILIADLACNDHKYRDRYLKRVKLDNSSWDIHDDAFTGTGNALVDNMLIDYRLMPGVGMI